MNKCYKCIHKSICIDDANYKYAESCNRYLDKDSFKYCSSWQMECWIFSWQEWILKKQNNAFSTFLITPNLYYSDI